MANEAIREANTKKAIDAAVESMLKNGIQATSKEYISRVTGLSLASIVRYFPTKDDMVIAVVKEISKDMHLSIDDFEGNGAERFNAFLDTVLEKFFEKPEIHVLRANVIVYSKFNATKGLVTLMESLGYRQCYRDILTLGEADGSIKLTSDVDRRLIVDAFPNVLFSYMSDTAARYNLSDPLQKESVKAMLKMLVRALTKSIIV